MRIRIWIQLIQGLGMVSTAGTFQPNTLFVNKRIQNSQNLVLRDVPGEDRTMDSYNDAINRAFRRVAAASSTSQQEGEGGSTTSEDGDGDSSMSQYISALNQQGGGSGTTIVGQQQIDSAMASYMEAVASVQDPPQGGNGVSGEDLSPGAQARQKMAENYAPNLDDLVSQHDELQQQQQQQQQQQDPQSAVPPMGQQVQSMPTIQDQHNTIMQPFQTSPQQQEYFQQQQQRQEQQQQQQSFQPDPEPQQQQHQQQAATTTPAMSVEQRLWGNQQNQQYYKKPQTGSIFDKDYKYKNSVPRIGDMYEMGPPPVGYQDPAAEAAAKLAAQQQQEQAAAAAAAQKKQQEEAAAAAAKQQQQQAQAQAQQQQQQAQAAAAAAAAAAPKVEQTAEQRLWGNQQNQQYYKKPQTGSIFDKDYKYKNSVPRIGDMYEMGPPPKGVEAAFPVEATTSTPQAGAGATGATGAVSPGSGVEEVKVPEAAAPAAEVPAANAGATNAVEGTAATKTDPEDLMAAEMAQGMVGGTPEHQTTAESGGTSAAAAAAAASEAFQVDPEEAPVSPPPKKQAIIASFPDFGSFTDATQDSEYDAYGNLKRKPVSSQSGTISMQPLSKPTEGFGPKEGPPPPDMVIPAVSQLPDWAQNPFPEMGSSAPTASLEGAARASPPQPAPASTNYAPAPTDMVIPAVSQLPDWAQNPFPAMGNSQPTISLEAAARSAPSPAPQPQPQDLMIPAVTHQQLPSWAQDPFPQMGTSKPTASLEAMGQSPTSFTPPPAPEPAASSSSNDMLIGCSIESYSDLPDWVLESQKNGPKSEVIDETFANFDPTKPRVDLTPQPVETPQAQAAAAATSVAPVTPVQGSVDTSSVPQPQAAAAAAAAAASVAPATPMQGSVGTSSVPQAQAAAAAAAATTSSVAPMTTMQGSVDTSSVPAVSPVQDTGSSATPVTQLQDPVSTSSSPPLSLAPEKVFCSSSEGATTPESKIDEPKQDVTAQADPATDASCEKAMDEKEKPEISAPKKPDRKSWKPRSEVERPINLFGKAKKETKKKTQKKERPKRDRPAEKASGGQEDVFAAFMDVMSPINKKGAEKGQQDKDDPMDLFTEMMAPKRDFATPTIPSFGADSVDSVQEVPLSEKRNFRAPHSIPNLTKKALENASKEDDPKLDQSKDELALEKEGVVSREEAATATNKEEEVGVSQEEHSVTSKAPTSKKQEEVLSKKDVPGTEDASATAQTNHFAFAPQKEYAFAPKREYIEASKKDVTPRRTVGGAPASAFPKNVVSPFRKGLDGHAKKKAQVTPKTTVELPPTPDKDLLAEVEKAMAAYEEAMALADKGADLRETVQHVLDAEEGPLSGWTSVSKNHRLFGGGKDDAIRAHNHMKELQKEQARKETIDAYRRVSQNDTSFFMNMNEPTMLMMDLQKKENGAEMPSLMLSTDSDVVEGILQDKPDLSKNLLGSTSSSILVVSDDDKPQDDVRRLKARADEGELDSSCDDTERILKRAKISEGYTAWDAFQKLEMEWDALEASNSARYDPKWLRKVQNGVPPPYQFVTEDATWSQPHCWDKLRVQRNKKLDYDVIVAGGSVGIFFAMALQLKGMVVCVVEGSDLVGDMRDWKVSMEEMLELKSLGIITQDDLEAAVEIPLKDKDGQAPEGEVFVSPSILIERVAERFKNGGGTILEQTPMTGIAISEYAGAAVNLGEGRDAITANLIVDCIGEKSPIARQRRYGRVPDGVCAVVGSCAAGFDNKDRDNTEGTMVKASEKTELGQQRKKQFFWESIPKDKSGLFDEIEESKGADEKTTYMFTYVDGDEERPPFKSLMDDYWRRLAASQQSSKKATELEVKRVMFAYFPTFRNSEDEPQWSRILDLGGLHDSLCVAGLSPMIPHLGRISNAILEALDNECLHKDDLAEINAYIPSLSATWMFQQTMADHDDEVKQEVANQLLAASEGGEDLGNLPANPFLQDSVSFDSIVDNPSLLQETVQQAGLPKVLDWIKHGSMMSVYDKFDKNIAPKLEEKVEKLEPRQKFRWRRRLEAWKIGSGQSHKKERQ